ncbi:MAG: hypothetical protein IPO16_14360 [Saprospiraceae bacterium]|nr:hypothetical protein [Saprospiraceae bacterium]
MKESHDLEPQQYQRMYWEEDVPLQDLRKKLLRYSWWLGLILFAVFIALSFLLKFPDQFELPFVFKRDQAEHIYRYPYPVYLLEVKIAAGNSVKTGTDLLEITSPEIVVLINNLEEAEQNLLNYGQQKTISLGKQATIISRQKQQNTLRVIELRNQLTKINSQWESSRSLLEYEYNDAVMKADSYKKLFESKDISKFEWIDIESKKIKTKDALQQALKKYEIEKSSLLASIENETLNSRNEEDALLKLKADIKYDSTYYINQLALAKSKISHVFGAYEVKGGNLILKAEKEGTVSYLFEAEKEVPGGVILMKIIEGENSVYASVSCPPALIGKINNDQPVFLKVASFPFYEWGSVKSQLYNRSLTPDEKGNFNLKIRILEAGQLDGLLQAGMNGNAVIILEEKSFMEYFFRNVKRVYHSSMGNN